MGYTCPSFPFHALRVLSLTTGNVSQIFRKYAPHLHRLLSHFVSKKILAGVSSFYADPGRHRLMPFASECGSDFLFDADPDPDPDPDPT